MQTIRTLRALRRLVLAAAAVTLACCAMAQQAEQYIRVTPQVAGMLYSPAAPSAHAHVAVVVMHDYSDFLSHPATRNLQARGFTVLAANPRYAPDLNDRDTDWDVALADLGATVRKAQSLPGIRKVVLLGHSSGAALAAAYQSIAEGGVAACQGSEKIVPCPSSLAGLPKADGVVLLDPILGLGANVLTSMDPALASGADAAALDLLEPANGFSAQGAVYTPEFRRSFLDAQARRNAQVLRQAAARLAALKAGEGAFLDDEPFVVPGATRTPRLWRPDLSLLSRTRRSHLLLAGDGSERTQVITGVRVPSGLTRAVADHNDREAARPATAGPAGLPEVRPLLLGGSLDTTVRRFLSTFASRSLPGYQVTENDITGIDWNSSYNSVPGSLEGVRSPLLIMGMTGHYWIVSSEIAWRHARSQDKSLAFVEGATHTFGPCKPCEKTPGQFGDTEKTTFDYVARWLSQRF
ncbi:MAG: hypothetical protein DI563_08505 [Variovorax paradoxus]|uniref:Alpha/beta hydrolase n=1 Tax=Variovorax paradoxus TaxID=34073 RepID=A0A2W5QF79_VARPD|nr:MAG: hypothetical protein DI563_08505 [Variovorax paradoxus]